MQLSDVQNVPNATLPNFPLRGDTIAYNMDIQPISLVVNSTQNNVFSIGLYAFYEKNNSVWYKYKTNITAWTSDEYFLTNGNGGISSARTIFDSVGFPVTAYQDVNGNIGVSYFDDNQNLISNSTNFSGNSPNPLLYNGNIILMFLPENYEGNLVFLNSADFFTKAYIYPTAIPNNVISFTVVQNTNNNWNFSFVSQNMNNNFIFYSNT